MQLEKGIGQTKQSRRDILHIYGGAKFVNVTLLVVMSNRLHLVSGATDSFQRRCHSSGSGCVVCSAIGWVFNPAFKHTIHSFTFNDSTLKRPPMPPQVKRNPFRRAGLLVTQICGPNRFRHKHLIITYIHTLNKLTYIYGTNIKHHHMYKHCYILWKMD